MLQGRITIFPKLASDHSRQHHEQLAGNNRTVSTDVDKIDASATTTSAIPDRLEVQSLLCTGAGSFEIANGLNSETIQAADPLVTLQTAFTGGTLV